ncbi:type VI secretion system tip protein VgrG [Variovorax sp. ZS18.2.2]|uniref:type VI secretion system Vgr family protein n=1 Tax=Variovorax sp. ZS18.2.2 TaxID=2971255 RepID=UPI00215182BF|nr:type VI secretion system Vgr family protein [Variovorax sp. ZS18.2.2]MCR6478227.1 type VI secretion system tip protein VgrG [Variovorax sp. ZS18.2.2]
MPQTLSISSTAISPIQDHPGLEPVRLAGREGMNSLFEYELLLKTPDALNPGADGAADFDLDAFIGREINCTIELDGSGAFVPGATGSGSSHIGSGVRQINALVTDAAIWGEEGRHIQYKLTLRPWLHLATLTTDCKIFQDKTVVQILDELLADYAFPVDKRLFETYPVRDFQTQFNETDFDFFSRMCEEWGLSYHFEHNEGKHRLVLSDAMGAYKPADSAAYREVEYHAPGWKVDAEYISSFVPHAHLTSGQYSTRDYDYTRPRADLSVSRKEPRPTGQAGAEVYQWHAVHAGSHYAQPRAGQAQRNDPHDEGRLLALLRMQTLRTHGERAEASGNLRGMCPGCTFELQKHPREKSNTEYLVLDTHFVIENVAQDSQNKDAERARRQQWHVLVDFTAHPVTQPLRPASTRAKPQAGGPQSALVVGPEGQNLWTDELGRIKVQFPWDRIGLKNQHSTCWLRVSSPWAGNQLGGIHIPRIGQEVLVDFLGGDLDLPICTGRIHNQSNLPPWVLPNQSALSGFRSRELTKEGGNSASGRSNHLAFDDTDGKIQAQIKSDHQHSQLSLGHITRIEDNAGRKDPRGQGFELRTDGHGAVRANSGLLLTTEPRPNARSHVLDSAETAIRLLQGQDQHDSLAAAAMKAEAHETGDQDEVAQALKKQGDEIKGHGGNRAEGEFPEFLAPHLVLASPVGIATTTPNSTHLASGEHIALTSGSHTSISSNRSFLVSAAHAVRMFAFKGLVKIVAAQEDIDITALKKSIHMLAKKDITLRANRITLDADEIVTINGGTSYSLWKKASIEHGTSGLWREYAGSHSLQPQKDLPLPEIKFPTTLCEDCVLKALKSGSLVAAVGG